MGAAVLGGSCSSWCCSCGICSSWCCSFGSCSGRLRLKSVTTSDTYVPENNTNRTKLSWGELQVAGVVKTSSLTDMDTTSAKPPVDTRVKGGTSTDAYSSKPTLIDSDGFLFSEDNSTDENNKSTEQNSPFSLHLLKIVPIPFFGRRREQQKVQYQPQKLQTVLLPLKQ